MTDRPRFFITTAIDYPNSRPHIGTAFEKIGADVQARYRRMQGFEVVFLMGNDENTTKVSKKAAELGLDPKTYCDRMAGEFREVWDALGITLDVFIQTSHDRHRDCCRKFIQKVYDNGHIYLGNYEGWYCDGCEEFKTDKQHAENNGLCPNHQRPLTRRTEECYFFRLSAFQDRLLAHYRANPDFIQPESRRNEIVSLIESEGLRDVNITRTGEDWGIRVPFDERFTIYVWFDALLTYVTGIGYGDDPATFNKFWPADIQFIGKDITRFHCALWPAMLWAAGEEAPRQVFGHGFVYRKDDSTGERVKESKTLGNVTEPMDLITKFSSEAFRFYFMRECPFPSDGDFSWGRFIDVYNSGLANNLGNLYSRVTTIIAGRYDCVLTGSAGREPRPVEEGQNAEATVREIQSHVEACQYNQALQKVWEQVLDPANRFLEKNEPWKVVKTDKAAALPVLYDAAEQLRAAAILLKPFLPKISEKIYRSFNFAKPWEEVRFEDVYRRPKQVEDLKLLAELDEKGKVKPLLPRIQQEKKQEGKS